MNCKYQVKLKTTQHTNSITISPDCAELRVSNTTDGTVFFGGMPIPTQQAICLHELVDSCYKEPLELYIPAGTTGLVYITRSIKTIDTCP